MPSRARSPHRMRQREAGTAPGNRPARSAPPDPGPATSPLSWIPPARETNPCRHGAAVNTGRAPGERPAAARRESPTASPSPAHRPYPACPRPGFRFRRAPWPEGRATRPGAAPRMRPGRSGAPFRAPTCVVAPPSSSVRPVCSFLVPRAVHRCAVRQHRDPDLLDPPAVHHAYGQADASNLD